ncbi:MAG: hypothetical protein HQK52_04955 [Oligoflexia bacterium]|nr:hypothetical protein [Oligoflexia bacterium]
MYEPYAFTSRLNSKKYQYPGKIPIGEEQAEVTPTTLHWDKMQLESFLAPVVAWQTRHSIASNRILVGEFGVYRFNTGAQNYLSDLIQIFNHHHWHWAFYSFREDTWDGMDYELGSKKAPAKYWQSIEQNKIPGNDVYKPNPLSTLLRSALHENAK